MALFAIADLHLSFGVEKPMDVFGSDWDAHADRLAIRWRELVTSEDTVLIPGDISWAMTLEQASLDLEYLAGLPGRKVMIRGNHDYWWHSIGKVRARLAPNMLALQNDAVQVDSVVVCGTRGWLVPGHPKFTVDDQKIFLREVERLRMSLSAAVKLGRPMIAMLHYPPTLALTDSTLFTDLLEEFGVTLCVYGHLHGHAHRHRVEGERRGVQYVLTSSDFLQFSPLRLST